MSHLKSETKRPDLERALIFKRRKDRMLLNFLLPVFTTFRKNYQY